MINLFEMMRTAHNGEILDIFGKQFGLANADVEKTMSLIMPVFAKGLKHKAASPADFAKLMQQFSPENFMSFQKDPKEAFRDDVIEEGKSFLDQMLGSSDASKEIADQIALASGVGPAIVKKMMSGMVGFMAEGINQNFQKSAPEPMDMLNFWKNMQDAMLNKPKESKAPDLLADMMNWPQNIEKAMQQENPFVKMMQDFLTLEETDKQELEIEEPPTKESFENFIDTMFETGRTVQNDYQKSLDKFFASL